MPVGPDRFEQQQIIANNSIAGNPLRDLAGGLVTDGAGNILLSGGGSTATSPSISTSTSTPTATSGSGVSTGTSSVSPSADIPQSAGAEVPEGAVLDPTLIEQTPEQQLTGTGSALDQPTPLAEAIEAQIPVATATTAGGAVVADPNAFDFEAAGFTAAQAGTNVPLATAQTLEQTPEQLVTAAQGVLSSDTFAAFAQAAQPGTVDPNSLVQVQFQQLFNGDFETVPPWARQAVRRAEEAAAARGLGQSSIAIGAIATAVVESSLPLAQQNATTFATLNLENLKISHATMLQKAAALVSVDAQNLNNRQQSAIQNAVNTLNLDLANLSNEQQTEVLNTQQLFAGLLSDVAARNAASQFNAASQNQVDTFLAGLQGDMAKFSAQQLNQMVAFNVAQQNQITALNAQNAAQILDSNAQRAAAISEFNAAMEDAREKFNAQQALIIEQANVQWNRQVATANTLIANAVNEFNASNVFSLTSQDIAAINLRLRDEAFFANASSENALDRNTALALASFDRDTALTLQGQQAENNFFSALGNFASNVVGNVLVNSLGGSSEGSITT